MYKYVKRILDVVIAFIALILLAPLFALIAFLIKIDSRGPVFFKQVRLGKEAKEFEIYKFRSMCQGAEQMGTGQYSFAGDSRVTKIGKFLRATSIDELPQLINILKGDMSLVGFRPPLTYHPWRIEEYTPEQRRMFSVRPGITGWAQVNGRKHAEWHERIARNVYYTEHMSLWLDLKIIWLTVLSVLKNEDNENVAVTVKGTAADENAEKDMEVIL